MKIDILNDILLFIEVVNTGNFATAAKKHHLSKPSVSRRISNLEKDLKTQLIKRTTRKLSLTEAGKMLYAQCAEIPLLVDVAVSELAEHKQKPAGKLKIGISSYFANDFHAIEQIGKFMLTYPDISVECHSFTTLVDVDLVGKDFDIYFTDNDLTGSKLISTLLYQYHLQLCASPNYIQRHGKIKSIADLQHHNCLLHYLYEKPIDKWQYVEKQKIKTITVNGNFQGSRSHLLLKMARAHLGITLLPTFMIRKYLDNGSLVSILDDVKFKPAEVYYTLYRSKETPKKLDFFIEYIKEYVNNELNRYHLRKI